ncbi:hypothetical protein BDW67DRAFT_171499 [Aspergillus spinulosporus]
MLARDQQRRQRQRIQLQLTRGRILRNDIVKHLGPGILFSPRVWDLIKMPSNVLGATVAEILKKPEQKMLLELLGQQLERMVSTGSTDLDAFLLDLKEHKLVPEDMQSPLVSAGRRVENCGSNHAAAFKSRLPQIPEPIFKAYDRGFELENLCVTAEDISTVQENVTALKENTDVDWLTTSHIRLFCLYLRQNLLQGDHPGRIYIFCPLAIDTLKRGWQSICEQEDLQAKETNVSSAHYHVFPLHDKDHWFTVIVSTPGGLATVETPTVYVLDSKWFAWKKELYESMRQLIAQMTGSSAVRSPIPFYEASEGALPQQSAELCGYYLLLYLELLAMNPEGFLARIRDFNRAKSKMDSIFPPGKMDQDLVKRFATLIEEFQHADQREGRLVAASGRLMFDGDLRCLGHDVYLNATAEDRGEVV